MSETLIKSKQIAVGDFLTRKYTSNGQAVLALSMSPLTEDCESVLDIDARTSLPGAFEFEASMSQRVRHDFVAAQLSGSDKKAIPSDANIVSIYQSTATDGAAYNATAGTVLTVTLDAPLSSDVFLSDWVHVYGLTDNRLNYPNLTIRWISLDRKTFCAGFSDETALPSLAATYTPAAGTAKVKFYGNLGGCTDGMAMRFTGTTATQAAVASVFNGHDVQISGTLQGDHRVTIGSTAPIYTAGAAGNVEIKATSRYRMELSRRDTAWMDKSSDTNAVWTPRVQRTSVKPRDVALRPRFRAMSPKSISRPIAKIVSASKSASTTATVVTDVPHGLQTGAYVTAKGVRDTTNFAAITTPVAVTVVNATTVQFTWGASVTATSYGGSLVIANGGVDQPGVLGQAVQSAQWDATIGTLTLVGSAAWSGVSVGDYVDAHGVRDSASGADLGVDGPWEVVNLSTTNMVLAPVFDVDGSRVSPVVTSLALTNCGGTVIHRTTLRVHDVTCDTWEDEERVVVDGQGTDRIDRAVPTRIVSAAPVQGGTAVGSNVPNPVGVGGRAATSAPTTRSNGQLVDALMTSIGASVVKPFSIPESDWSYTGTITVTSDTTMKAAGGAGIKQYLTGLQMQNTGAAATTVTIKDGSTARWIVSLPASMATPIAFDFPTPIPASANTNLNVACGTASSVYVNAQGYTAA